MKKGFYDNVPNDVYHAKDGFYSSSVLKTALDSPSEFYNVYILGKESSKKMNKAKLLLGSAVHTLLLEGHKFWDEYAVYEGKSKQGKAWEVFKLDYEGLNHLSQSQYDTAISMQKAFNKHKIIYTDGSTIYGPDLFKGGIAEQSIYTTLLDIPVKIRPDYRKGHIIRDLKTTEWDFGTKHEAKNLIYTMSYELSAAMYVDAYVEAYNKKYKKKITNKDVTWEWVLVSTKTNKIKVYQASEEILEKGRNMYKDAIRLIKLWKETGEYSVSDVELL